MKFWTLIFYKNKHKKRYVHKYMIIAIRFSFCLCKKTFLRVTLYSWARQLDFNFSLLTRVDSPYRTLCLTTQDHSTPTLSYIWCTISCYKLNKPSLCTHTGSSWNVCSRHWSRRSQFWLIARVYYLSMSLPGLM